MREKGAIAPFLRYDKKTCQNELTSFFVNDIVKMTRKVVKGARAYAIT